jgi:hypothetical protein
VPLNVECNNFAWREGGPSPDARGASGVARLKNDSMNRQVFLPSYDSSANYLDCRIRILDDIMLKYGVSFLTKKGDSVKSIGLTQYYTNKVIKGTAIQLVCKKRTVLPAGCKKQGETIVIER